MIDSEHNVKGDQMLCYNPYESNKSYCSFNLKFIFKFTPNIVNIESRLCSCYIELQLVVEYFKMTDLSLAHIKDMIKNSTFSAIMIVLSIISIICGICYCCRLIQGRWDIDYFEHPNQILLYLEIQGAGVL